MPDLFTQDIFGRIAIHIATDSQVILLRAQWYKGKLSYDVIVPIEENKKVVMCNATYSHEELKI